MSGKSKWLAGELRLSGPTGDFIVDGHRCDPFAIDRRAYWKPGMIQQAAGYVVSHLPTGWAICAVKGSATKAKSLVAELAKLDWDFHSPADIPLETKHGFKAIAARNAVCHVSEMMLIEWRPA